MSILPSRFWDAWDSYVEWSIDLGLTGLDILSFTEAFIQPVPPEMLTNTMFEGEQADIGLIFMI